MGEVFTKTDKLNSYLQMSTATTTLPKYVKYVTSITLEASPYSFAPKGIAHKGQGNPGLEKIMNPGEQNIPNTCTISEYDDTLKIYKQRYLRYINGCSSVYVDEQIKMGYAALDKYKASQADVIKLEGRGELICFPEGKPSLYEYLEKCPYNRDSKFRTSQSTTIFFRDNAQKKADELNHERRLRAKALNIVEQVSDDPTQLTKMAAVLGLDTNQLASQLVNELGVRAEHTPQLIIDAFGSDEGDVAELVYYATEHNIIHFTGFAWNFSDATDGEGKIMGMGTKGKQDEGAGRKKLISYLQTQDGELHRTTLQKMVKQKQNQ